MRKLKLRIVPPVNDPLPMNWTQNLLVSMKGSGHLEKLRDRWIKNATWLKVILYRTS